MRPNNALNVLKVCIFLFIGILFCKRALGQSGSITPVPTWTQDQWDDVATDKDAMLKEQEIEFEQRVKEGKVTPVPLPKDFTPGAKEPLPPTNLKITIVNGMAYLSWDKVENILGYIVSESKDGKKYKTRRNPIHETKILVGYVASRNHPIKYFGISTLSWNGKSKMSIREIAPKDFGTKQ